MKLSSVAQALAAISFAHMVAADTVVDVVMETEVVTVTAGGWEGDRKNWGGWPYPTTTSSTTSATPSSKTTSTTPSATPSFTTVPELSTTFSTAVSTSTQASDTSEPSPTASSSPFADAVLNSTNYFRAQYEAAPVVWNDTLTDFAQSWASRCYFAHSGGDYGENIAAAWPTLSAMDGVDMWGDEESEYDWAAATFSEGTGHFTQLVWQSTTSIGCALVTCQNTDTANGGIDNGDFLVCEYSPAGNVIGYFAENVKKSSSKRDVNGLEKRSGAEKSVGLSWSG